MKSFLLLREGQLWGKKCMLGYLLNYYYAFRAKYLLATETCLVSRPRKSCLSWIWLNIIEMGRKNLNCRSPESSFADNFREKDFLTF